MGISCGIVGLPNVGKSTLFNALTSAEAQAANYPFCTIDPNIGVVSVPDLRLTKVTSIFKPEKTTPTVIEFVDIAGLVRGASKGEGLGNQFLGHIRQVDAVAHIVRCFDDSNIVHVDGPTHPARDIDTIHTELCLADLETVTKTFDKAQSAAKGGDKDLLARVETLKRIQTGLASGVPVRLMVLSEDEKPILKEMHLLTAKPTLYVCNVAEGEVGKPNPYVDAVRAIAAKEGAEMVEISAQVEAEIAQLPIEERKHFLEGLGLEESGLDRMIHAAYRLLGLVTFFTVGPDECRAWTITNGTKAPQAAGTIHTDFERGFIRAEIYSYDALETCGTEAAVKAKGLTRLEGKEYVMKDGDITFFRFNV